MPRPFWVAGEVLPGKVLFFPILLPRRWRWETRAVSRERHLFFVSAVMGVRRYKIDSDSPR